MTDHEQTRQAVANVTVDDVCHLVRLGMAGESKSVEMYARKIAYRLRNDDSGLTQRLAEMLGRGDLLRESATPCPAAATVSEAELSVRERVELGRVCYENFTMLPGTIGTPASWEETARWPEERRPWIDAAIAVRNHVLAARTTARAPEPTEAEIEQIHRHMLDKHDQHVARWVIAEVLIAARNAGQGVGND